MKFRCVGFDIRHALRSLRSGVRCSTVVVSVGSGPHAGDEVPERSHQWLFQRLTQEGVLGHVVILFAVVDEGVMVGGNASVVVAVGRRGDGPGGPVAVSVVVGVDAEAFDRESEILSNVMLSFHFSLVHCAVIT